jgi:4a-hydroxytetrahydrobiopterin dehydratase
MLKLSTAEIKEELKRLPGWKKRNQTIVRVFTFKDFVAAIKFVNAVAKIAEGAWHHPDIHVRWNQVTLVLTTHDRGGLTAQDFELAHRFDQRAK